MRPRIRNIDGKKYTGALNPGTKNQKRKEANLARQRGYLVRTIPIMGQRAYLNFYSQSSSPATKRYKRINSIGSFQKPKNRFITNNVARTYDKHSTICNCQNCNSSRFVQKGTYSRVYEKNRRPQMVVIGENLIPMSQSNNYSASYGNNLDVEQSRGVDLMVSSLLDRPDNSLGKSDGGFLLADGTGFGKTRQLLAVADQWKKESPKTGFSSKVLIVTENKETIDGSFKKDAEALGINTNDFQFTTYTQLASKSKAGQKIAGEKYGLVIYDEAHNMKNLLSFQSEVSRSIETDKAIFATATPLDTAPGAGYFLSRVSGIDQDTIFNSLGIVKERGAGGIEYYTSVLPPRTIKKRLENYREQLIASGLMMRRTYPFYGSIISSSVKMNKGAQLEQEDILDFYANQVKKSATTSGQRSLELARWEEYQKIPTIYENIKTSIEDGKQVVVALKTSGEQTFRGLKENDNELTKKEAERRVRELNERYFVKSGIRPGLFAKFKNKKDGWYPGRKGATEIIIEMLERDGISYSQLTQSQKGIKEVNKFQNGESQVMIMTPQSGGTGINLDDSNGDKPRHLIIGSAGWAGDKMEQILGRVSRKTTKSPSLAEIVGLQGGFADSRQKIVLKDKLSALRSITGKTDGMEIGGGKLGLWDDIISDRQLKSMKLGYVVKPLNPMIDPLNVRSSRNELEVFGG